MLGGRDWDVIFRVAICYLWQNRNDVFSAYSPFVDSIVARIKYMVLNVKESWKLPNVS